MLGQRPSPTRGTVGVEHAASEQAADALGVDDHLTDQAAERPDGAVVPVMIARNPVDVPVQYIDGSVLSRSVLVTTERRCAMWPLMM